MEDTYHYYCHHSLRKWVSNRIGSWEEDKLYIRFKFYKVSAWQPVESEPVVINEHVTKLAERDFWVHFSCIKEKLYNNNGWDAEYEAFFSEHLTEMGVPNDQHAAAILKFFETVEDAESPVELLILSVCDVTQRIDLNPGDYPCRPNLRPASSSFIEGLEVVTLNGAIITASPSCAICLGDFDQQEPITELPCRHHFHMHCIVQCLEINHLCPYCRCPMPTQED